MADNASNDENVKAEQTKVIDDKNKNNDSNYKNDDEKQKNNENDKNDDENNKKTNNDDDDLPEDLTQTTAQQQRKGMKKIGIRMQQVGDEWYPISKKWYDGWVAYTMFNKGDDDIPGGIDNLDKRNVPRPGRIDNDELQDDKNPDALNRNIQEHRTHIWIHSDVWNLLYSWYEGGPAFPRTVYERGSTFSKEKYICTYPQLVKLVYCDDKTGEIDTTKYEVRGFPHDYTLKALAKDLEKELPADEEEEKKRNQKDKVDQPMVHIWLKFGQVKAIYPIDKKVTITEEDLANEDMERWVEIPDDYLKTKLEDIQLNDVVIEDENTANEGDDDDDNNNNNDKEKDKEDDDKPDDDDKPPTKGGDVKIQKGSEYIVIERKNKKEKTWPRCIKGDDWKTTLVAGDIIDVKDEQEKWYEALIRYVYPDDSEDHKDDIIVHYIGWNIKWDECLSKNNEERVANRQTNTTKPHRPRKKDWSGGYRDNSFSFWQNENGPPEQRGVVGLRNLGNTCFMNSTIQCLAQSPALTEYFLNNEYIHHVNKKNPLGWGGRVAKAWALLLHDMFSGKYKVIAPRQFKNAVGEVAPRFMGYAQQDSQELLSFVLDGLHEDLNQIENKPSTEPVEANGRKNSVVAREAWKTYLRRNQSVIVDLLQGQYKSIVCCPDCGRVSVTFDPYMFLSVPLPTEKFKMIEYTWIDSDTSIAPTVYGQKMLRVADIGMLKESVAKARGVNKDELFVCDIWKSKIHRELRRNDSVGDINRKSDDIFIYHSPNPDVTKYKNKYNDKADKENKENKDNKDNDKAEAGGVGAGGAAGGGAGDDAGNDKAGGDKGGDGGDAGGDDDDERDEGGRNSDYDDDYNVGGSSYYGGYYRNRYNNNKKKKPYQTFVVNNLHRVQARSHYMGSNRSEDENFGFPLLVTLPMKIKVTMKQIREKLWNLIQPFIKNQELKMNDYKNLPFKLWAAWGFNNHEEVKDVDDLFDLHLRNLKFVIHWSDSDQYDIDLVDIQTRKRDKTAPAAIDTKGIGSMNDDDHRRQRGKPIDLVQCIEAFCEKEILSENDAWYCSKCKDFKCATKKIDLWNSPDLLIIHLKRFSYTRNWRDRINTVVRFPLEDLDLTRYVQSSDSKPDAIYDLYAVSNHMGGMGGGHYTAYAKNLDNQQWYHLDDSRTSKVHNPNNIVSSAAYVLYYTKQKRRGLKQRASRVILPELDQLKEKEKQK